MPGAHRLGCSQNPLPQESLAVFKQALRPRLPRADSIALTPEPGDLTRQSTKNGYIVHMSYLTLEVEIDHGRVSTKEPSKLPEKASGLLTILQPEAAGLPKLTPLEALDALQKHLQLDAGKAAAWMATARDARR
jgi:hypothetical protein